MCSENSQVRRHLVIQVVWLLTKLNCVLSVCLSVQVPVPVFLPTTLQGAEQIIETINELKNKVPSDLLSMAEMITGDQKPDTHVEGSLSGFKHYGSKM